MKQINIVFDIDGTLACHSAPTIGEAAFFYKKGAIIPAIKTHYIVPGVIELMKLLFQMEHVTVSFFSAGVSERNEVFVKELLSLALGKERYDQIASKVRILSRDDMVRGDEGPKSMHGLGHGTYKKDLSVFLKEADVLQNAVLIEDDYSYVAFGQEKNVLTLPMAFELYFSELKRNRKDYGDDEYIPIDPILQKDEPSEHDLKRIMRADKIVVSPQGSEYKVFYACKKTNQCGQTTIGREKHKKLIDSLDLLCKKSKDWETICLTDKPSGQEIIKEIYEVLDSVEGRTRTIHSDVNTIFYLTGMLFKSMEIAQTKQIPLSEVLFQMQYKPGKKEETYEHLFYEAVHREEMYALGLEKLREVNENITFVTPKNYSECVEEPLSKEEKDFLSLAMKQENSYLGF